MALRKSTGNMYPWVTHTHSALGGECPHKCSYCYVNNPRFGRPKRYCGELRLIEEEMHTNLGAGRTIFKENCNDLFAKLVPDNFILAILNHCSQYPDNTYILQTKNPDRAVEWVEDMPKDVMLGTTIETNLSMSERSLAPHPEARIRGLRDWGGKKFITIEPIMDFNTEIMIGWITEIRPDFVNIGADSKGHGLPEPSPRKVADLIAGIQLAGIEIREKHNLDRLLR